MTRRFQIHRRAARWVLAGVAGLALAAAGPSAQAYPYVMYFDVEDGYSEGPPYPSAPDILTKTYDTATPLLATLPLEEVSFNYSMTPPTVGTSMVGADTGGGIGLAGTVAAFDVYLKMDSPQPPELLAMDMFLKIESGGGVGSIVCGPVQYRETDFEAEMDVQLLNGQATAKRVHGSFGAGQPLTFGAIQWEYVPAEAYDAFLKIEMNSTGALDTASPILHLSLTGSYVPEPAALSVLALGGVALIRRRRR